MQWVTIYYLISRCFLVICFFITTLHNFFVTFAGICQYYLISKMIAICNNFCDLHGVPEFSHAFVGGKTSGSSSCGITGVAERSSVPMMQCLEPAVPVATECPPWAVDCRNKSCQQELNPWETSDVKYSSAYRNLPMCLGLPQLFQLEWPVQTVSMRLTES